MTPAPALDLTTSLRGDFHSEPVHFGSFGENVQAGGLLNLVRYILAVLGENVPLGRFLRSSGQGGGGGLLQNVKSWSFA